ncbi:ABC transporter permease subunit [Telmatospirillum siberiense]|uniref:Amino acid ABC transporter permease n=1 Tax=Telmatospirillum siberiense TaxID=382514 RepID=A0A2N3PRH5_9PROT|nr:ABC transporter permease subunit [Telmatospirillum siberiense]PKU23003.1 amino acid ABC transporter permease [Telmatospirillum siberiense]
MTSAALPARAGSRTLQSIARIGSAATLLILFAGIGSTVGWPGLRFDFLSQHSGFQISESLFQIGADAPIWLMLIAGLINTIRVSAMAMVLTIPLGIALALLRGSAFRPGRWLATGVIEPIRNTPVLLQLFLWYGIVTQLLPGPRQAVEIPPGILLCNRGLYFPWFDGSGVTWPKLAGFNIEGGLSISPEFTVLVFGLALFHGCYLAEIFRAGFLAVPRGQRDAAKALSMPAFSTLRKILLPQALAFALPSTAAQILALVKNSSLAIAIGFADFVAVLNTSVNQNGRTLEGLIVIILVFLGLNTLLGAAVEKGTRRFGKATRGQLAVERQSMEDRKPAGLRVCSDIAMIATATAIFLPAIVRIFRWGVLDAAWAGSPADCAMANGACWAVVTEKAPLLLFGPFPGAETWRPLIATLLIILFIIALGIDRLRHAGVSLAALAATMIGWIWLLGGGAGLASVPTNAWGGLSLTSGLAVAVVMGACLLALPLALARRSPHKTIHIPAVIFIEIFRGVPLVALLLSADILIPGLLPSGWQFDKLWRAYAAITLLASVNLAEVMRGALAAVAPGQTEAARALGLSARRSFLLVILPQAIRIAMPALVNVFVGAIKDTSLVLIVGILDITGAAKAAVADPAWRNFAPEIYLFLAAVYFALCFPIGRLARRMTDQTTADSPSRKRSISAASL